MKLIEVEVNVQTGVEIENEIQLTTEQENEIVANRAKSAQQLAEAEAKATAKAALLERLGITQDEANLLLS